MNKLNSIKSEQERMYAFIDETGNSSLDIDKNGTSSYFINYCDNCI